MQSFDLCPLERFTSVQDNQPIFAGAGIYTLVTYVTFLTYI